MISVKRIALLIAAVVVLSTTALAYTVPDSTIVYVTPTGSKYHREDCTYTGTVQALTIATAERQGYAPCSRCDPDRLTGEYKSDWDGESGTRSKSGTNSASQKSSNMVTVGDIFACILLGSLVLIFLYGLIQPIIAEILKGIRRRKK